MLRCPRLPAAAAASTLRALVPHAYPGAVCPALSSVLQLPHRPGAGAPTGIQPHLSLAGLSLRALSDSAPAARPEKAPESGEPQPQPEHDSDKLPAPLPARVVGERVHGGDDVLCVFRRNGIIVDKTLVCKELLETPADAVRICLPRRFGKSFNLSVIEHFFNLVTVNDCLGHPGEPGLDAARDRRRQLFRGSLFEQFHPDFVEKHFASVPVIKINFACSGGHTLGFFHASLASAIYDAATFWIDAYAAPELLKGRARAKYEALQHTYSSMSISLGEDESKWEARGGLASVLFKGLSGFLVAQHGHKYIILVDEYDQPLEAALGKKW
ncbi:hypothetical protein IWQ56_001594 [Coemansia nantahalensis]|nr:hypothetical protein IWQ56_001594 [Coemansia nantahalensis]